MRRTTDVTNCDFDPLYGSSTGKQSWFLCWFSGDEIAFCPHVTGSEFARALKTHDLPSQSGLIPTTLRVRWCASTTGRDWET